MGRETGDGKMRIAVCCARVSYSVEQKEQWKRREIEERTDSRKGKVDQRRSRGTEQDKSMNRRTRMKRKRI
jgi:hypothetical protein